MTNYCSHINCIRFEAKVGSVLCFIQGPCGLPLSGVASALGAIESKADCIPLIERSLLANVLPPLMSTPLTFSLAMSSLNSASVKSPQMVKGGAPAESSLMVTLL